jgi:stearoyl-CoA desaturase (delta-9 desaturase)
MAVFAFFWGHWYLSLFTQSFFHHRYSAHAMFSMSKGWEKVFYFLTFIFQGASYLSPRAYGILHRLHHAHADTELDPHSPKYSTSLFQMMWKTRLVYNACNEKSDTFKESLKRNLPDWPWMDWFAGTWALRIFWGVSYFAFYYYFEAEIWMYLFLPIQFLMGPVHGAIINWTAHKFGYRNFEVEDTSRNLMPIDVFMLGEGFHNNHHSRPGSPNFGWKWYEFDPLFPIIRFFNSVGIIKLRPVAE